MRTLQDQTNFTGSIEKSADIVAYGQFVGGQWQGKVDPFTHLSLSKTFAVHKHHLIKFTASAFNWLNHPLPTFGSGQSTTEYYFYNYTTHAITVTIHAPISVARRGALPPA